MAKVVMPKKGENPPDNRSRHVRLVEQELKKGHTLHIDLARGGARFSDTKSKISLAQALEAADELGDEYPTQINVVGKAR